jgi:DNA invertase Pin-like site-specific DNA recombinase
MIENEDKQKAVIYCRVSTKEQVDEGNSLVTQERLCREYAIREGFIVDSIYIERGESARTAERNALKKMLAYCLSRKNEISAVIVYKIDRLSRNMTDYLQIRFNLKRYNVEVRSTSEQFEDSPSGRFMENMFANVAQFDNEVRGERALNGLKEAVREGRYVWSAPIGYKNIKVEGKSTIAPSEHAPLIQKTFELLAENKYSIEDVRRQILQIGFREQKFKLAKAHFNRLIRNPIYTGKIAKFGTITVGKFEPIISEELFNTVQHIISKQKEKRSYTKTNADFPLRQFCQTLLGSRLSGGFSRGKLGKWYPYYFFKKEFINLKRDVVDNGFIDLFNEYAFNEDKLKKLRDLIRVKLKLFYEKVKHERKSLDAQIDKIVAAENTLVLKLTDGKLTDSIFQDQMEVLSKQKEVLKSKATLLPVSDINFDHMFFAIKDFLIAPGDFWKRASITMKIKIQGFNFPKGIIYDMEKIRTQESPLFYNALLAEPSPFSLNAGHQFLRLNTPKIGRFLQSKKRLSIIDYFTSEEIEQIQEYVEFLLDLGRICKNEATELPNVYGASII